MPQIAAGVAQPIVVPAGYVLALLSRTLGYASFGPGRQGGQSIELGAPQNLGPWPEQRTVYLQPQGTALDYALLPQAALQPLQGPAIGQPSLVGMMLLAQSGVPFGIAPSGTIATNGTVTLGTALNLTYSGGIWLYFPAGAVVGGAAGFYWVVMSSATVGVVYTDASAAKIVVGSNAAYTGVTTEVTAASVALPANVIGPNGSLCVNVQASTNSTAGAKTVRTKLGSATVGTDAVTTSLALGVYRTINNRGGVARQVSGPVSSAGVGTAVVESTVDTSQAQAFTITLQKAAATDTLVMESMALELYPG
jgi:hypothetical protein